MRLIRQVKVALLIDVIVITVFPSFPVTAASFDCKSATSVVEKMICNDAKVSTMDDQLAVVYLQALVAAPDVNTLKHEQRDWLTKRGRCRDVSCLRDSYHTRIAQLRGALGARGESGKGNDRPGATPEVIGTWEPHGKAFIGTGNLRISSSGLKHEACRFTFDLIKSTPKVLTFRARSKGTCCRVSGEDPLTVIKITIEDEDEALVSYYSTDNENSLWGEGGYNKIK